LENQKIAAFGSSYTESSTPVGAAEGCDLLIFVFDLFGITPIPKQSSRPRHFLLPGSVLSGEPGQSELDFTQYLQACKRHPRKGWNRL
jgi:hypothetical protein